MRSMTGFGRGSGESSSHAVNITLRGVNHRFLDLRLRLDEPYTDSEPALRELFSGALHRGRVDARVEVRRLGSKGVKVELQRDVLEALKAAVSQLHEEGWGGGELATADLLRLPEVLVMEFQPEAWTAEDHQLLVDVAGRALAQLSAARKEEGQRLREALDAGLERLEELVLELESRRQEAVQEMRGTFEKRLQDLLDGTSLDPGRLEQEVAILVDRSDVQEELDRLRSHLRHFRSLMGEEGSIGKRLDFLTQELMRELNTFGAKCRNATIIRSVLAAKSTCEQLREQVQNVE